MMEDWMMFIRSCRASIYFGDPFPGFVKHLVVTLSNGTVIRHDEERDMFVNIRVIPRCQVPLTPIPSKKIFGFFHICALGDWKNIVANQVTLLKESGLYDVTERIFFSLLGKVDAVGLFGDDPKFVCIHRDTETLAYERPTLEFMRTFALSRSKDTALWYIHSKGVTRNEPGVKDWVDLLNYFTIQRHQRVRTILDGCHVAGVNWSSFPDHHFSGNFWWARSSYIGLLPITIRKEYVAPEFWIAAANPVVNCIHHSGLHPGHHYRVRYLPERYVRHEIGQYGGSDTLSVNCDVDELPELFEVAGNDGKKHIVLNIPRDRDAERENLFGTGSKSATLVRRQSIVAASIGTKYRLVDVCVSGATIAYILALM